MIEVKFIDGELLTFDSLVYEHSWITTESTIIIFTPRQGKTGSGYSIPITQIKYIKVP